jgi:GTPase KRas
MSKKTIYVLGDGGVGKSCLTLRFVNNNFIEDYDPTIEDSYTKNVLVDNVNHIVEIVDTAGQEEYSSMRYDWIKNADGILLIYSIDNQTSIIQLEYIMDEIFRIKEIPIILVGNKCDLKEREISKEQGIQLAKQWNVKFYETSAKTLINNKIIFYEMIKLISKKREYNEIIRAKTIQSMKKINKCHIL